MDIVEFKQDIPTHSPCSASKPLHRKSSLSLPWNLKSALRSTPRRRNHPKVVRRWRSLARRLPFAATMDTVSLQLWKIRQMAPMVMKPLAACRSCKWVSSNVWVENGVNDLCITGSEMMFLEFMWFIHGEAINVRCPHLWNSHPLQRKTEILPASNAAGGCHVPHVQLDQDWHPPWLGLIVFWWIGHGLVNCFRYFRTNSPEPIE